jgi:hypothetical protein
VHHGDSVDDIDTLRTFLLNVWQFFLLLIIDNEQFQERAEFLAKLDEIKYS